MQLAFQNQVILQQESCVSANQFTGRASEIVVLNFMVPKLSKVGDNRYILVFIDHLIKC